MSRIWGGPPGHREGGVEGPPPGARREPWMRWYSWCECGVCGPQRQTPEHARVDLRLHLRAAARAAA